MLPNLALIAATIGLLAIMGLSYREVGQEFGTVEKTSFLGGAAVIVLVLVVHLVATAGGSGH